MHRSSFPHSVLIILAALLCIPALAFGQDQAATPVPVGQYETTDLGTLGGSSIAYGVNQAGQVVGEAAIASNEESGDPVPRAVLWSDGTMIDLGTLGGNASWAQDINEAGQVIGSAETADGTTRAFLWEDGTMTDLGTLGGDHSEAFRINEAGQVVGHSTTAPGQELLDPGIHAFLWEDGTMTDLGTLPSFGGGRAIDMNDDGWVVGFAVDPLGDVQATPVVGPPLERHAWLCRGGELIDLGTLGRTNSSALGLNNHGQVVGFSEIVIQDTPGAEASPVAGEESPPPTHAFIWQEGMMTDLNDPASGNEFLLETAFAINDAGQIVGGAIVGDEYHAFLLAPVQGQ